MWPGNFIFCRCLDAMVIGSLSWCGRFTMKVSGQFARRDSERMFLLREQRPADTGFRLRQPHAVPLSPQPREF